jgi:flavorubredoxin
MAKRSAIVTLPFFFYHRYQVLHEGIPVIIRIAYFSWKGHTEKVATALALLLDAELVRIEPLTEFNIAIGGIKAILAMRSPIKHCKTNLAGIDELIIATPVWAGRVPPYVNEYLSEVSGGEEKPFHVIAEMGGRGSEGAIAAVRKQLDRNGMYFVSSAATLERDVDSGAFTEMVEAFAAGIKKK